MKKILLVLALIGMLTFLFIGCDVTTPGGNGGAEGEGEGEGDEEVTRVVMIELFVAPACTYCPDAKADKIVVLEEYAWNYPLSLSSGWATPETINRYSMYTSDGATPDAYFNGLNQSVHQGSSSYNNYKNAIDMELAKSAQVAISASASKDSTAKLINISGNIQNIGINAFNNIIIGAMIYENSVSLIVPGKPTYTVNHVVRDILTPEQVSSLFSEETYNFSFTANSEDLKYVDNFNNLHIVVYVQAPNSSTKEILQALYIE